MLRRNLPLWKPEKTIREAVAFCLDVGIDEIIWKIDPEDFNHGFTSHELIRRFLPWLEKARQELADNGIVFSINPWVTLNHAYRGRYPDGPPAGFHWRVMPDGTEAVERACPLSAGWRKWFLEAYRLFASVGPDKLWLEDDFKTFADNPTKLGCFCAKHLEAFSEKLGQTVGREELVKRLTAPGAPDAIRAAWLDFQGAIMIDICRSVEKVVHEVSPDTRLGLMNSWSTDARWWADAVRSLAGAHRPLARTSLAPYQEGGPADWMPDALDVLKESACLADGTENCPELENCPYTPYSKSARTTRMQILFSQALGNRALTMNLYDMVGSPFEANARFGSLLKELRPTLDGVAAVAPAGGVARGVSVPFPKRYADKAYAAPDQGFDVFRFDGEGWALPLQGSGAPVVLNGADGVSALTGQSARALDRPTLERILSNGALLDGSAATVLCELGYAQWIGVEPGQKVNRLDVLLAAERDDDAPDNCADDPAYIVVWVITAYGDDWIYPLRLRDGARAASWFVDNEHRDAMPGMTLFENSAGGRVATYPADLSRNTRPIFMNWRRRSQLQRVLTWLGRDKAPLIVDGGAWMIPIRRDYTEYTFVAALNVEHDAWDRLELTFEGRWPMDRTQFEILGGGGALRTIRPASLQSDGTNIRARFDLEVAPLDAVMMRISEG